jgi:hypothetical protein
LSADLLSALVPIPFNFIAVPVACNKNAALCELSQAGMFYFNLFHLPRSDVAYHFIGGDVTLWGLYIFHLFGFIPIPIWYPDIAGGGFNFLIWPISAAVIPGPDDGFIPTWSSLGIGLPGVRSRLTTDEVHNARFQGNGLFSQKKASSRDYFSHYGGQSTGYRRCLKPVLVDKTSHICR